MASETPCAAGRAAGPPHGGMTMSSAPNIEPIDPREPLGLVTI
jgi:hypothetical protein